MNTPQHTTSTRDLAEIERNAYNLAFFALGLDWFWDVQTYASLRATPRDGCHVRDFLETKSPHLLRAYDADFLVNAIEAQRTQIIQNTLN